MVLFVHDDAIKWKHFPRNWPFVRGIHRSPVNSPHKGQWRGALMFSLICVWINDWVNNREAGDVRRYRAHYDVIVMSGRMHNGGPSQWKDFTHCNFGDAKMTLFSKFKMLITFCSTRQHSVVICAKFCSDLMAEIGVVAKSNFLWIRIASKTSFVQWIPYNMHELQCIDMPPKFLLVVS